MFKDPLKGGCIEQRCDTEKASVLDLIYNDHDLFYIEFFLIKTFMHLIDYYSGVDLV